MGLCYESLDERTRAFMLEELAKDEAAGRLYISGRLTREGAERYPKLLREALTSYRDDWLAERLRGLMAEREPSSRSKTGDKAVPHNADATLAEGEFNRYYIRGVCRQVEADGGTEVEIYRGKTVAAPRDESQMMVGTRIDAAKVLADLRANSGVNTALGLPPGPNSGLTVRVPVAPVKDVVG